MQYHNVPPSCHGNTPRVQVVLQSANICIQTSIFIPIGWWALDNSHKICGILVYGKDESVTMSLCVGHCKVMDITK